MLALILMWYARYISWLRWPLLALNLAVLISTPEQGGHHLVDVLGAIPVAALAIAISEFRAKLKIVMNDLQMENIASVATGPFRSAAAQK